MTNTWILAKMHTDSAQSKANIAEIPSALQVCQAIMQTLKSIRLAEAEDSILVADYKKNLWPLDVLRVLKFGGFI